LPAAFARATGDVVAQVVHGPLGGDRQGAAELLDTGAGEQRRRAAVDRGGREGRRGPREDLLQRAGEAR
jgi:hypothetical protein